MSEEGIEQIDALTVPEAVNRSEVIRILLSEALRHPAVLREARKRIAELAARQATKRSR